MLRKQPTIVLIHLSLGFDELLFGKFIRHAQPPEVSASPIKKRKEFPGDRSEAIAIIAHMENDTG